MYHQYFSAYEKLTRDSRIQERMKNRPFTIFEHLGLLKDQSELSGFKRIEKCRMALAAIDKRGWDRSFHQRDFHESFIRASARVFWKTEPPGQFQKDHQYILESNKWDHLAQEILVSTPRRFGKTISVSMFAAAMIFSAPKVQISIYSTCKRISQKLLENVYMFLDLIYRETNTEPMREIRKNMEQIVLAGNEVEQDHRVLSSYPSKVFSQNFHT